MARVNKYRLGSRRRDQGVKPRCGSLPLLCPRHLMQLHQPLGLANSAMIKLAVKPAGFSPLQASRRFAPSRRVATMAAKRVLVPIGRGSEEMEAVSARSGARAVPSSRGGGTPDRRRCCGGRWRFLAAGPVAAGAAA